MSWRRQLAKFRFLVRRPKPVDDLEEEIRSHLRMEEEENLESGMPPDEAHYAALRRFGNVTLAQERSREMWGWNSVETLWQDLRYGLRMLAKNPGFTLAAVVTLAFGIGANTTIFSLVNTVVLRPLPYPDAERLVRIETSSGALIPAADVAEIRSQSHTLESVGSYTHGAGFTMTGARAAARLSNVEVSPDLLRVLGVAPLLGRTFLAEEAAVGMNRVVIVSYSLWRQYLGADRGVIGKTINLDSQPYTIIGVMPQGFGFPDGFTDLWTPISPSSLQSSPRVASATFTIGRLKPHVDLRVAQAELNVIVQRLGRKSPEDENLGLRVTSLQEQAAGPVKKGFFILLGAVGMVLLLACLNVANLLLARNARRRREIAVRAALGASRLRLIRQLLVESLILAFLGGSLGLVSAPFGILILRALAPPRLPRLDNVGIDGWVLAFTLGVTVFTGIVVGVIPAIQVSRLNPVSSLKEESVGSAIGSGLIPLHRAQGALTTYQVALATILLIGAGLVVRSFSRLMGVNLGFDPHNLLTVQLGETSLMPLGKEAILSFYQRVLDEVRALPGVESVALGSIAPVAGVSVGTAINVEGGSPGTGEKGLFYPPWGGNPKLIVQTQDVSPAYFTTMRIRILRGRGFTIQDTPHVVIINEAAARRFWPNTNPLGRRIDVGGGGHNWCEVVGVADDVRDVGLEREPVPEIYSLIHAYSLESTLFVRADSKPQALGNAVVNRIWFVDKGEPVFEVITIEDLISKSVVGPRFHAALLSLFAVLALLMAALGVYGVVSYAVSQRTQEIGIRVALGATPRRIFVLVVGQQLIMAVFGMAIGLGAASALTRTISSLLYGVAPNDLGTFVGVPILLGLAALVASYMPARRAMRVDPMVALRYE